MRKMLRVLVIALFLFLAMGIYFIIFSPTLANEEKVINIRHGYVREGEKYWYGFQGKLEKLDFDQQTMSFVEAMGRSIHSVLRIAIPPQV